MRFLEPDCLDRYNDDVEAVVTDALHRADLPIGDLEGWISRRVQAATVDAHRRRRGERGALQRPRLPLWLHSELGGGPWLKRLAVEILVWVGVESTAGAGGLWPLDSWADLRRQTTGDSLSGPAAVLQDIDRVLTAMSARPGWYERFVERPLGRKQAPLLAEPVDERHLVRQRHELEESRLHELASQAVQSIEERLRHGDDPQRAVVEVITVLFGDSSGIHEMDQPPFTSRYEDAVDALVSDPARLAGLTDRVVALVAGREGALGDAASSGRTS